MLPLDYHTARIVEELRIKEMRTEADSWVQLRQAGIQPESWVYFQGCRLLRGLGHRLVGWGERLEQYGKPEIVAVRGATSSSR